MMIKKSWLLCMLLIPSLLSAQTPNGNPQSKDADSDSVLTSEIATNWNTTGLQQANTMGGAQAAIPKSGKFRVFVLI